MRIGSIGTPAMKCQTKVEDSDISMSSRMALRSSDLGNESTMMVDLQKPTWSCRLYLVIVLFSMSGTLGLEALWVTSPVSALHLPETHKVNTYLVVFAVVGNIAVIGYAIARKCAAAVGRLHVAYDAVPIYACLLVALLSCGLLALFWDEQLTLRHQEFHLIYLGAALGLAFVSCVGTVTYVPFVTRMKAEYVTAIIMGEALAGLIPHLVAIGQGIGEPPECRPEKPFNLTWTISGWRARLRPTTTLAPIVPPPLRFNESIFYFTMTGVLCISGFCFLVLRCIPSVREHYDPPPDGDLPNSNGGKQRSEHLCGVKSNRRKVRSIEEDNVELLTNAHHHQLNVGHHLAYHHHGVNEPATHPVILDDGSIRHVTPARPDDYHLEGPAAAPGVTYTNTYMDAIPGGAADPTNHPYTAIFPQNCPSGQQAFGTVNRYNAGVIHHPGGGLSTAGTDNRKRPLTPFKVPNMCLMLTFTFWACLVINGPLSSSKAHACLPLGNRAFQSGTLMTKVGAIIAVIATFRVNPYSRVTMVVAFTSLGTIVLTYFVALISFSHESDSKEDSPIFMNTGELLSTIAWASVVGLFYFTKSMVAVLLRQHRRELLVWYALVAQAGATLGALFMLDDYISICRIYRDFEKLYCKSSS